LFNYLFTHLLFHLHTHYDDTLCVKSTDTRRQVPNKCHRPTTYTISVDRMGKKKPPQHTLY